MIKTLHFEDDLCNFEASKPTRLPGFTAKRTVNPAVGDLVVDPSLGSGFRGGKMGSWEVGLV